MNDVFMKKITRRSFLESTCRLCCHIGMPLIVLGYLNTSFENGKNKTEANAPDTPDFESAYLKLHRTGELRERAEKLRTFMTECRLCPRKCGVNRLKGEVGGCRSPGATLVIASATQHFGEERPLVGRGGSGTIFLSHCGLRCVFCQNWEISHLGRGGRRKENDLSEMMLRLQRTGCHNINLVTPTHYSASILAALDIAAGRGLRLPVVYNTCGWERLEILEILDGIVDIYLPDFKFWDNDMAARFTAGAKDYPEVTRDAILEMHRQVGVARTPKDGIMRRGLMIRHLVMPNNTAGSGKIMKWIAESLPKDTYVNIMAQYNPLHKAYDYPELSRRITRDEYQQVVRSAEQAGLTNLDIQTAWRLRR